MNWPIGSTVDVMDGCLGAGENGCGLLEVVCGVLGIERDQGVMGRAVMEVPGESWNIVFFFVFCFCFCF